MNTAVTPTKWSRISFYRLDGKIGDSNWCHFFLFPSHALRTSKIICSYKLAAFVDATTSRLPCQKGCRTKLNNFLSFPQKKKTKTTHIKAKEHLGQHGKKKFNFISISPLSGNKKVPVTFFHQRHCHRHHRLRHHPWFGTHSFYPVQTFRKAPVSQSASRNLVYSDFVAQRSDIDDKEDCRWKFKWQNPAWDNCWCVRRRTVPFDCMTMD